MTVRKKHHLKNMFIKVMDDQIVIGEETYLDDTLYNIRLVYENDPIKLRLLEIISNDEIIYTQIKNPYLNNLGPEGIFVSGLDGNNVKTVLLTNPVNKSLKGVRYLMPRMSPLKDKILYVKEDESLYVLEIDVNFNLICCRSFFR